VLLGLLARNERLAIGLRLIGSTTSQIRNSVLCKGRVDRRESGSGMSSMSLSSMLEPAMLDPSNPSLREAVGFELPDRSKVCHSQADR